METSLFDFDQQKKLIVDYDIYHVKSLKFDAEHVLFQSFCCKTFLEHT